MKVLAFEVEESVETSYHDYGMCSEILYIRINECGGLKIYEDLCVHMSMNISDYLPTNRWHEFIYTQEM